MPPIARSMVLVVVASTAVACRPDLGAPTSLVDRPRVLAILAEPPEAAPGEGVTLRTFVASPDGTIDAPADWSLCLEPNPVADNNVVADSCATGASGSLGSGISIAAALPDDACARFGP